jgi:uncharacterized protein (DUF111 family)
MKSFFTLTDGRGTVHTRHGLMPVPVPAVAKLCEGYALKILPIESELLTPTGCAVLTTLGKQVDSGISGNILKTGYGCGDKVFEKSPNVLRVFLLETDSQAGFETDAVWCLESDMDHISGEIMGDVGGRLMLAGALDVSWCPMFHEKRTSRLSPHRTLFNGEKGRIRRPHHAPHTHARHTDAAHGKDHCTSPHGDRAIL